MTQSPHLSSADIPTENPGLSHLDLQGLSPLQIHKMADELGITLEDHDTLPILRRVLLEKSSRQAGYMYGDGVMELMPEGFGFLRSAQNSYLASLDDIYMPSSLVRDYHLRQGQEVAGWIRPPKKSERYFAMEKIDVIGGRLPAEAAKLIPFEDLIPLHPQDRLLMEVPSGDIDNRIIDLICPLGRGQRALIVAPPRVGKTVLLQKMARGLTHNHGDLRVFVLLIDERPEEVTHFRRETPERVEVVASTFDESISRHIQVCDMVIAKARFCVENGEHVVILMDSITRMARAYSNGMAGSGKIISGGLDATAMQRPKKFFGSARAIEHGGSLTIIATALIETNSRADEVIFEEFKGTGNAELYLDRSLSEKRVYPAIDIAASGTRRDELLLDPMELKLIHRLRRVLGTMDPIEAMELLKNRLSQVSSNAEFLMTASLESQ